MWRAQPEGAEADLGDVARRLREGWAGSAGWTVGETEVRPMCFGLMQLMVAAEVPESVDLDEVVRVVEELSGVSSCAVRSSRRVEAAAEVVEEPDVLLQRT